KNGPAQGILANGMTSYDEFINLKVHDNGTSDFDHGLYLSGNNSLIDGSEFYRNAGWGVHLFGDGPSNNIVRNNRVHDNARLGNRGAGIGSYGFNNLAYNNAIWRNAEGFELGGANNRLYNNTIYSNNNGSGCLCGISLGSASTTIVKNNVIYQHGGGGIQQG